jgi:hypothetical protein
VSSFALLGKPAVAPKPGFETASSCFPCGPTHGASFLSQLEADVPPWQFTGRAQSLERL